jgi:hypothetical protein
MLTRYKHWLAVTALWLVGVAVFMSPLNWRWG